MEPGCDLQGLPPDLMPWRGPGAGLGPGFQPQVPPIAQMVPGDSAPDQLLRVRGFEEIPAGGGPGVFPEGPARSIEFPDDGWVIGLLGVARANGSRDAQTALQFRATVGDEIGQFVTQGLDASFATFQAFGQNEWEWQPLARRVSKLERWNFTCRNIGANAVLPDLTLKFRALRAPGMYAPQMLGPELAANAPIVVCETAPDRIVRVDGLTTISAGQQGNVRTVQFPEPGYVTAVLAAAPYVEGGDYSAIRTSLGVQIQWGDTGGYFTTDGQANDFALVSCWGNDRARWMPYFRAVSRTEKYSVSCFNFHPDTDFPAPEVLFKFRSIRSLQR